MKKNIKVLFIMILILTLCACGNSNKQSSEDITIKFFDAFETSNYELMKLYCTSDCIEKYFHDNDVNGMVWAKIRDMGQEENEDNGFSYVFVTVDMKTSEISALYPDTETSFYVELQKQENGELLINSFPTGK